MVTHSGLPIVNHSPNRKGLPWTHQSPHEPPRLPRTPVRTAVHKELVQQPDAVGVYYILLGIGGDSAMRPSPTSCSTCPPSMLLAFPAKPSILLISSSVTLALPNDESTSQRSTASSVYRWKWAVGKARSRDPVEHRPVTQHRQVEPCTIERDQPWL
jgi:hypothetical protein